jgi:hypothetical protein
MTVRRSEQRTASGLGVVGPHWGVRRQDGHHRDGGQIQAVDHWVVGFRVPAVAHGRLGYRRETDRFLNPVVRLGSHLARHEGILVRRTRTMTAYAATQTEICSAGG